jgi:hypothetical protein
MMKKLVLIPVLICFLFFTFADEPMLPPQNYTNFFANGRYMLVCDATKKETTCYEIVDPTADVETEEKWRIPRWGLYSYLSENGEFCVLDDWGGLIPLDYDAEYVLYVVFKNGTEYAKIKLFDVISDKKNLRRTASHYYWGNIESFENDGIVLNTVEGKKWYDFNTRKVTEYVE